MRRTLNRMVYGRDIFVYSIRLLWAIDVPMMLSLALLHCAVRALRLVARSVL